MGDTIKVSDEDEKHIEVVKELLSAQTLSQALILACRALPVHLETIEMQNQELTLLRKKISEINEQRSNTHKLEPIIVDGTRYY